MEPVDEAAVEWIEAANTGRIVARTPELALAETANALTRYIRAGRLGRQKGVDILRYVLDLPLDVASLRILAVPALALAATRRLSAYDACYLALASGYGAVLVTADRRLAAAATRSALLPGTGPPAA